MDLALRFATRCATAYRSGGDRTRRLFYAAVLDEVHVRDGHVVEATYKEPFDLLFSVPKFVYDDVVVLRWHKAKPFAEVHGPLMPLPPPNTVVQSGSGDR